MNAALSLEVELRPDWPNIDRTQEAVGLLALSIYGNDDLRDAIAMVSAELLENALKYALPDTGVRLSIQEESSTIVVAVTNTVLEPDRVRRLEERLAWLRTFDSAEAAYTAAIELALSKRDTSGGLGIVRIAYEGGCGIACDTSEPGMITVRASMGRAL